MTHRRRVVVLTSLTAVLAIAIVVILITRQPTQSVTLPDGSRLKLLKTGYGRAMHYSVAGGALDKALYSWVPDSWMDKSRVPSGTNATSLRTKIGSIALKHSTPFWAATNALVLWLEHTASTTNLSDNFRVAPVDENGSGLTHAAGRILSQKNPMSRLIGATATAFPRRGEFVRLRVYGISNSVWTTVGEFTVRNPDRRRVASWPATPLPATTIVDGEAVTLQHFWSGVGGTPPQLQPDPQGNTMMLEFRFDGSTERRRLGSMESVRITDATGNLWFEGAPGTSVRENTETVSLQARLPTNETLKIEVTLSRQRNFKPDQLWEVPGVPLPLPDQYTTVTNSSATRDGATIQFLGVSAPNVKFPVTGWGVGWSRQGSSPYAYFSVTPYTNRFAAKWRLSVVGMLDEEGRTVGNGPLVMRLGPNSRAPIRYPTNLTRAKFVFALHQPTNATFFVRVRNPTTPP